MPALILQGDALHVPLPDDSVDLIATSPPYWALRSYRDGEEHFAGQLGSEPDPFAFLDALLCATAEMVRVLKPSGSLWVNLGDKYADDGKWGGQSNNKQSASDRVGGYRTRRKTGLPRKSLIGLPWRYALACIDELGLILRAEVIWNKLNGLPESVTDRVRRSHEHLFHFTKEPTYYSAMDEVRERHAPGTAARYAQGYNARKVDDERPSVNTKLGGDTYDENPLGKLPGSVWSIPSEPLMIPDYFVEDALGWRMTNRKELWNYAWHQVVRAGDGRPIMVREIDHFAAFPQELPRRIVLGWSPSAICTACGQGRFPVTTSVGLNLSRPQARRAQQLAQEGGLTEAHFAALLSVGVSDTGRGKATQNGTGKNTPEVYALADHARTILGGYAREYLLRRPTSTGYACACTPRTRHPERRRKSSTPKRDDLTHRPPENNGSSNTLPPPGPPVIEYHLDGWDPPPTRPSLVLDPFGGTATTAGVASVLGRIGISLDLSLDYCRLARWRVERSGHFAKTIERTNRENQGSLL